MTEFRVLFSAQARRDLLAARRWLTQPGSGLKARLRLARISRALSELRFAPFRWALSEDGETREFSVEGYRIAYRIEEAARRVRVFRIFGPFQDRSTL